MASGSSGKGGAGGNAGRGKPSQASKRSPKRIPDAKGPGSKAGDFGAPF